MVFIGLASILPCSERGINLTVTVDGEKKHFYTCIYFKRKPNLWIKHTQKQTTIIEKFIEKFAQMIKSFLKSCTHGDNIWSRGSCVAT